MKDSKEILSSILKTTQMGQIGIRSVLNAPLQARLKDALRSKLREYHIIEQEGLELASAKGLVLKELNPAIKHMSNMMTKAKLSYGDPSSKVAAMMIQGNTKGIIKGYKNLNQFAVPDERIVALSRKLLDCEKENIQQMQGFL